MLKKFLYWLFGIDSLEKVSASSTQDDEDDFYDEAEKTLSDEEIEKIVDDFVSEFGNRPNGENLVDVLFKKEELDNDDTTFRVINLFLKKIPQIKIAELDSLLVLSEGFDFELPPSKVENVKITLDYDQKWIYLINAFGLYNLVHLFKDENCEGVTSMEFLNTIQPSLGSGENYYKGLFEYFANGDGGKYFEEPESDELACQLAKRMIEVPVMFPFHDNAKFAERFIPLIELFKSHDDETFADFVKLLKAQPENLVWKFMSRDQFTGSYDGDNEGDKDYNQEWGLLYLDTELFFKYANSTYIIFDDKLYIFLMLNDVLPDKHKGDKRYSTEKIEEFENYKLPNVEWMHTSENDDDYDTLFDYCITHKLYVAESVWSRLSEEDAQNLLDSDRKYTENEFITYGYVLSGHKLMLRNLNEMIESELWVSLKDYYARHFK